MLSEKEEFEIMKEMISIYDKNLGKVKYPREIREDLEFVTSPTLISEAFKELSLYFFEKGRRESNYEAYEISGIFKNAMVSFDVAVKRAHKILMEGKYGIETD